MEIQIFRLTWMLFIHRIHIYPVIWPTSCYYCMESIIIDNEYQDQDDTVANVLSEIYEEYSEEISSSRISDSEDQDQDNQAANVPSGIYEEYSEEISSSRISKLSCANKSTDTKQLIRNLYLSQVTPRHSIHIRDDTTFRPTWYIQANVSVETGYLKVQPYGEYVNVILDLGSKGNKTVCKANIFECPPSTIPVVGCYCSSSHYWFDNPVCFYEATLNITVIAEIEQSESQITFEVLGDRYSRSVDSRVPRLPVIANDFKFSKFKFGQAYSDEIYSSRISSKSCANKSNDTTELIHRFHPSQVKPSKPSKIQFCKGTESRPTWYVKLDIQIETGYLEVHEFGDYIDVILDYGTQRQKTVCSANIFECQHSTIPVVGCYCNSSHYWFDNPVCFYQATLNITVTAEVGQSESTITFEGLGERYSKSDDGRVNKLPVIEAISCTTTNTNPNDEDEDANDTIVSKSLSILPYALGTFALGLLIGGTIYWCITRYRKRWSSSKSEGETQETSKREQDNVETDGSENLQSVHLSLNSKSTVSTGTKIRTIGSSIDPEPINRSVSIHSKNQQSKKFSVNPTTTSSSTTG